MCRKGWLACVLMVVLVFGALGSAESMGEDMNISWSVVTIDGRDFPIDAEGNAINTYNGWGAVSCNNTSRLLLDYKEENPEAYWKLMNLLFNPETGAGLTSIKVEMGADVNTSSGTEPATKRTAEEPANVLRGAGWHFAADAKSINPEIKIEILRWGEPSWTGTDFDKRYQWYKETIDAVYDTFGLKIDYVSPGQNERNDMSGSNTRNMDWIKYFANRLKEETDGRYDYSQIKIVAADTYRKPETASLILGDPELRDLVDVFSYHYDLSGHPSLTKLSQEYGIEVWYGEAIAPMVRAENRYHVDPDRGGIGGTTGVVDIAQRFINMYRWSGSSANPARMTKFMMQPAVIANYQGAQYNPKDLISAHYPWSGYFETDAGIQMIQHFNWFIDHDWVYLEGACFGDGSWTDGGVAVDSSNHNYLTLKDPETDHFSMVHANNTAFTRYYEIRIKDLKTAGQPLYLWETRGPDPGEPLDANWMKQIGVVEPTLGDDGMYTARFVVKPYSVLTVSTLSNGLDNRAAEYVSGSNDSPAADTILPLPYTDDFEYAEYPVDENGRTYLERRGGTPRYTTDQYGAFEVVMDEDGNHVLQQIIGYDQRGYEWSVWGNHREDNQTHIRPNTVLGDYRWANYKAQIDFKLDDAVVPNQPNYAGIGVRQVMYGEHDPAGYSFLVYADGRYQLCRKGAVVRQGRINDFDPNGWHTMALEAADNTLTAYLDGEEITSYTDIADNSVMSGRIAILSGYYHTKYDNLQVLPIAGYAWASEKLDNTDPRIRYSDATRWTHSVNEGFAAFHNRTKSVGMASEKTIVRHTDTTTVPGTLNRVYYHRYSKPGGWGSNQNDAWASHTPGEEAYAELYFEGVGFDFFARGQNTANATADVYLDGEYHGSIVFSGSATTRHYYTVSGLEPGIHSVRIVPTGTATASVVRFEIESADDGEPIDPKKSRTWFSLDFTGTGFNLFGNTDAAVLNIYLNDELVAENVQISSRANNRDTSYFFRGLEYGDYNLTVYVMSGTFTLDGVDILGELQ